MSIKAFQLNNRILILWTNNNHLATMEESGVIHGKKVIVKLKSKLHNTVVRPTMVYEAESELGTVQTRRTAFRKLKC